MTGSKALYVTLQASRQHCGGERSGSFGGGMNWPASGGSWRNSTVPL